MQRQHRWLPHPLSSPLALFLANAIEEGLGNWRAVLELFLESAPIARVCVLSLHRCCLSYSPALLMLEFSFLSHPRMPLFSLCGNYPAQPLGYPNTSHSAVVILAAQLGRGSRGTVEQTHIA